MSRRPLVARRALLFAAAFASSSSVGGPLPGMPPAAAAEQRPSEGARAARVHFRQGEAHYAAGKYAEALAAYKAGYDVQPLPGFLVNMAQCQRRMGDLERARATYGKFIVVAPDSPLAPEVRVLIQELDRLIAEAAAAERLPPAMASGSRTGAGATGDDRTGRPPPMAPDMNAVAGVEEILPLGATEVGGAQKTALGADLRTVPNNAATPLDGTSERSGAPVASSSRRRWWLWGSVGGAVLVAAAVAVVVLVASAPEATVVTEGSLGTLRR